MPAPGGSERSGVFRGDGWAAPASTPWVLRARPARRPPNDRRPVCAGSELQRKLERGTEVSSLLQSHMPLAAFCPVQRRALSSHEVPSPFPQFTGGATCHLDFHPGRVPGTRSCESWQGPVRTHMSRKDFGVTLLSLEIKAILGRSQPIK